MQKIISFFTLILLLAACGSDAPSETTISIEDTPPQRTEATGQADSETLNTPVDQADDATSEISPEHFAANQKFRREAYSKLITGEWQAVSDPNWTIKLSGNTFEQFKNKKPASSETFTITLNCAETDCAKDLGWCLTTDQGCYAVKGADAQNLRLRFPNMDVVEVFTKVVSK